MATWRPAVLATAVLLGSAPAAAAQDFEAGGTRALGMGGAFVGVADDATAVYWNPGGLAGGAYFSLVLDRTGADSKPDSGLRAGTRSATILALSVPALGLGYYRLRETSVTPLPTEQAQQDRNSTQEGVVRVDNLVTHHAGVTVVQSVTRTVAVGTTLKLVRGLAASSVGPATERDALLDRGSEVMGRASTKFDLDVGVMAALGRMRAGLTVRNVRQPEFEAAGGGPVRQLKRQARAGISVRPRGVLLAADLDLTRQAGPLGDVRNLAAGAEARILPRAFIRGGVRVNTIGSDAYGRSKVLTAGSSVAVTSSVLIDALISTGSETGSRGWGVAGRVAF